MSDSRSSAESRQAPPDGGPSIQTSDGQSVDRAEAALRAARPKLPEIDATSLRNMGEFADGFRDKPMVIRTRYFDGHEKPYVMPADGPDPYEHLGGPVRELFRVHTNPEINPRTRPKVDITVHGRHPDNWEKIKDDVDALFWTESSIEKFLFPYYAHMRIMDWKDVAHLKDCYYNKTRTPFILAFAHTAPSQANKLTDPTGGIHLLVAHSDEPAKAEARFLTFSTVGELREFFAADSTPDAAEPD